MKNNFYQFIMLSTFFYIACGQPKFVNLSEQSWNDKDQHTYWFNFHACNSNGKFNTCLDNFIKYAPNSYGFTCTGPKVFIKKKRK